MNGMKLWYWYWCWMKSMRLRRWWSQCCLYCCLFLLFIIIHSNLLCCYLRGRTWKLGQHFTTKYLIIIIIWWRHFSDIWDRMHVVHIKMRSSQCHWHRKKKFKEEENVFMREWMNNNQNWHGTIEGKVCAWRKEGWCWGNWKKNVKGKGIGLNFCFFAIFFRFWPLYSKASPVPFQDLWKMLLETSGVAKWGPWSALQPLFFGKMLKN